MKRSSAALVFAAMAAMGGQLSSHMRQIFECAPMVLRAQQPVRSRDSWRPQPGRRGRNGWSVAEGKRRSLRARNRARHKRHCGARSRS